MTKSKEWNWKIVDKNDLYWLTPSRELYYLASDWHGKGFKKFLDMGCGMGRNSVFMALNGFDVYAFDLSEESVQRTKENAEKAGAILKEVCIADMLEMPYADNTFDCIFAMYVVSHTDTAGFKKTMGEIKRVLKCGGEAYFTVLSNDAKCLENADNEVIDAHTVLLNEDGPEKGVPHFAIGREDINEFFGIFDIVEIRKTLQIKGEDTSSPHYHVWIKKALS